MYVLILKILIFLIAATVDGKNVQNEELPDLKWPKKYKFEATITSLTSGLIQDVQYWRTSKSSRVDYSHGAVKTISFKGKKKTKYPYGVQYDIHPETSEEYTNKLVCTPTNGSRYDVITPKNILPSVSSFNHVGKDFLEVGDVEKFIDEDEDDDYYNQKTIKYLWASLDRNTSSWTPVRYQVLEYNTWISSLKINVLWNIINYETDFEESVFDIDNYDCKDVETDKNDQHNSVRAFKKFKKQHKKQYSSKDEHIKRRQIFESNLRLIESHNSKNKSYSLGINKFADLTRLDMRKKMGLRRRREGEAGTIEFPYTKEKITEIHETLPKNFDLRMLGVISPARDQEDCGSCWTFGTTSAVEGALARSNGGRLLRLANQALIDCAWGFGSYGCDGGSDTAAYHWMMKYGLPKEEEYGPYTNKDGFCRIMNMTTVYPIKGFTDVTPFSVEALKVALVNHGPLSVSIDATDALTFYTGGIFSDPECDPTSLNHEVTLVGYGVKDEEEYWIVKNSWGRDWGIDGYVHFSINDNSCGITTEPTYVVI